MNAPLLLPLPRLMLCAALALALVAPADAQQADSTQAIPLASGPNWVSLRVEPGDSSMAALTGPISEDLVLVKDGSGRHYSPRFGILDLETWSWNRGYVVTVDTPSELLVAGAPFAPEARPIPLSAGWHLIPYFGTESRPVAEALASIIDRLAVVQDQSGATYSPTGSDNTLQALQPGQAYRIRLALSDTLVYPAEVPEGEAAIAFSAASLTFPATAVGGTAERTLVVSNAGTAPLAVAAVTSTDGAFAAAPAAFTLAPSASRSVTVTFAPAAEGPAGGALVFAHDGPSSPDTVAVAGIGLSEASDLVVATIEEMLALETAEPGDQITVTDPTRGGTFVVTDREGDGGAPCVPDGGTCFVLTARTIPGVPRTGLSGNLSFFDASAARPVQWESLRLCHSVLPESLDPTRVAGDGCLDPIQLHGHGVDHPSYRPQRRLFNPTSAVTLNRYMRLYGEMYDGEPSLTATYRLASDGVRVERVIPALTLEGVPTTAYRRPEWWGAQTAEAAGTPEGQSPIATEEVAWAIESAADLAAAESSCPTPGVAASGGAYVVFSGLYANNGVVELGECVTLKGETDGVRDGQGLIVADGAAWHLWGTDWEDTAPAYHEPVDERDAVGVNVISMMAGNLVTKARVVDFEYDGNMPGNDFILSPEYRQASGPASGIWDSQVQMRLQNSNHWGGYATTVHTAFPPEAGTQHATLENVHIHDFGSNLVVGNWGADFGGSRDLRLGNTAINHMWYSAQTSPNRCVDGVEMYGFYRETAFIVTEGCFNDLSGSDWAPNPYDNRGMNQPLNRRPSYDRPASMHWGGQVIVDGYDIDWTTHPPHSPSRQGVSSLGGPQITYRGLQFTGDVVGYRGQVGGLIYSGTARLEDVTGVQPGDAPEMLTLKPQENGSRFLLYGLIMEDVPYADARNRGPKIDPWDNVNGRYELFVRDSRIVTKQFMTVAASGAQADSLRAYWKDTHLLRFDGDGKEFRASYFEGVTAEYCGGSRDNDRCGSSNRSDNAGTYTYTATGGETSIDLDPALFFVPQAPEYVRVSNVRVNGAAQNVYAGTWTNAGSDANGYKPVLRLALTRALNAGETVRFDWSAAVKPIPAGVVFPE